jgi:predicted Zn-dependent protease with MMP-like domain
MTREEFEACVDEALDSLPEEFERMMENIEVVVQGRPSPEQLRKMQLRAGHTLLGLYEGVPLGRRGIHYGNVPPDRITIFQQSMEHVYPPHRLVEEIRRTVLHEVGHYFGISDERLHELGY